jgi:AraC-like DNA-binding protein
LSYLTFDIPPQLGPRAQFVDLVIGVTALRLRQVTGDPELPLHIDIEHPIPRSAAEFYRVLGRNVRFDRPENRVGTETRLLSRPLPAADPELYRIVRQHAQSLLTQRERAADVVSRVTDDIVEALKGGDATLVGAAERLKMSPRALQRELENANTNFRDLVEATRRGLARHFMYDTSLRLTEIAFLLGFSELSAFSRWVRTWSGKSPRELRRTRADDDVHG